MNKKLALISMISLSIVLTGCNNIRKIAGMFSGSHIVYKEDIPEFRKFLGKKYEVIVDYLYLRKRAPYYYMVNSKRYVFLDGKPREDWIHVPLGAIFKVTSTARSNACMATGIYVLAKFETPGIIQRECNVWGVLWVRKKDSNDYERNYVANTRYFREIE